MSENVTKRNTVGSNGGLKETVHKKIFSGSGIQKLMLVIMCHMLYKFKQFN
jgi:hypothetical protein